MIKSALINFIVISLTIIFSGCDSSQNLIEIEPIKHPYKFSEETATKLNESSEPWKYQEAAGQYSYIGEYEKSLNIWDKEHNLIRKTNQEQIDAFNENFKSKEAKQYILNQADTVQVIIINEAHHHPLHRVFTAELLEELYEKGYHYLGLEALNIIDNEINNRKYPVYGSGTYSKEPQFGNLIRTALKIGYTLFAYEADGNGKEREIGQARNIENQIKKDSTSKYLIHCGYAHAAEGVYKPWEKAMAGRLQEFTNINPLTINQTEYTENSTDSLSNPILRNLELEESCVFVDSTNISFKNEENPNWYDIMIFHPKTKMENGRPNWIFKNNKKKVTVELNQIDLQKPYLVMAFKENEDYRKSIPFDIVEVDDNKLTITLALEKGGYNIIFQNQLKQAKLTTVNVD